MKQRPAQMYMTETGRLRWGPPQTPTGGAFMRQGDLWHWQEQNDALRAAQSAREENTDTCRRRINREH